MKTKMIVCEGCGATISKLAKVCPTCGEPSKQSKRFKMAFGLIMMGVGLMFLIPIVIVIIGVIAGVAVTP